MDQVNIFRTPSTWTGDCPVLEVGGVDLAAAVDAGRDHGHHRLRAQINVTSFTNNISVYFSIPLSSYLYFYLSICLSVCEPFYQSLSIYLPGPGFLSCTIMASSLSFLAGISGTSSLSDTSGNWLSEPDARAFIDKGESDAKTLDLFRNE